VLVIWIVAHIELIHAQSPQSPQSRQHAYRTPPQKATSYHPTQQRPLPWQAGTSHTAPVAAHGSGQVSHSQNYAESEKPHAVQNAKPGNWTEAHQTAYHEEQNYAERQNHLAVQNAEPGKEPQAQQNYAERQNHLAVQNAEPGKEPQAQQVNNSTGSEAVSQTQVYGNPAVNGNPDVQGNADNAGLVSAKTHKKKKKLNLNKLVVIPQLVNDLSVDGKPPKEADCDPTLQGKVFADEAGTNGRTPLGQPDPPPKAEDENQKAIDAVDTDDKMATDPKVLAQGIAVAEQAEKDLKRVVHRVQLLCSEPTCPMQA